MGATDVQVKVDDPVADQLVSVLPSDRKPWYRQAHLLKLNFFVLSLVMFCKLPLHPREPIPGRKLGELTSQSQQTASSNGYDGSLMNGLQALPRWNEFMNMPAGAWLGFINAAYWVANGISFFAAAWTSNKFGRKSSIYIGYVFLVVGTVLQSAAQDEGAFIAARALVGAASGWYTSGAPCSSTRSRILRTEPLRPLASSAASTLAALSPHGSPSEPETMAAPGLGDSHLYSRFSFRPWHFPASSWRQNLRDGLPPWIASMMQPK